MAFYTGRHCKINVEGTKVDLIGTWNLNMTADPINAEVFGDTWQKAAGVGLNKWDASFDGWLASDSTSQEGLELAFTQGTIITDIEFYFSDTEYYAPDINSDADAGCYISAFSPKATANGVVTLSISVTGSGPISRN